VFIFAISNIVDVFLVDFDNPIETTETSENDNEPTEEHYIETIAESLNTIEKEIYNIFYTPKFKLKNFGSVFETPPEYI
jgi:poly(3-hydroxyalkanoate) synthetase